MTKFIEVMLSNDLSALVNVALIASIVRGSDNNTKVFMQGDSTNEYLWVKTPYEDIKALIAKALSN